MSSQLVYLDLYVINSTFQTKYVVYILYFLKMARSVETCRSAYLILKTTNILLLLTSYFNTVLTPTAVPLPVNITHLMFPAHLLSSLRLHALRYLLFFS